MTFGEIEKMAGEIGLPYRYHHFDEGDEANVPDPPYVLWLLPGSNNFSADDQVYQGIRELDVELYTDRKDPASEAAVEAVLTRHGLVYEITEAYLETEKMYEVLYEMEVMYDGEQSE